jgi:prepilin-type N-terminal cleavage/methylation domain-containing protein
MKFIYRLRTKRTQGFTLVELMVVMVIVGMLAIIAAPAVAGLIQADNMDRAVTNVSMVLQQARAYAMADNTYVWVGFSKNAPTFGLNTLTIGAVAGVAGQQSDLGKGEYVAFIIPQTFNQMALKSGLSVEAYTQSGDLGEDISNSTLPSFTQTAGAASVPFSKVIQFDPQGEASLTSSVGTSHGIEIGLQPLRGVNTTDPNVAIVQVSSLTGIAQVFRP